MSPEQSTPINQDVKRAALSRVHALLKAAPLTDEERAAVALNAAVMLVGDMPGISAARGKVINAMCDEFRKRLQGMLPLSGRV
jgi:hypothetical protein